MHKKEKSYRKDALVLEATQVAREALTGLAREAAVGDHVEAKMVGERLSLHRFECLEEATQGGFGRSPWQEHHMPETSPSAK